ncbi:hypothetical protein ENSA5_26450 [Enhygromyxa salina]|uniref:Uncharacterized protein n=1 Tax=Enhygromyxa salina TaxID=215803 RepID=A0A2S9YAH8_9BACT|nr:hypothetical protein [Enhygromyxa salina]PRQ02103.1 hypothetical protein ENSA5_26450 [Enhygromyxa salina]
MLADDRIVFSRRGGFVTVRCTVEASARPDGIAWAHEIYDLEGLYDICVDDWSVAPAGSAVEETAKGCSAPPG